MACAKSRHGADAPARKHLLLRADVEDAFEIDEAADEIGDAPNRLAIDDGHLAGAGCDHVHRDVGRRFRAAEHHDLASLGERGVGVVRGVQDFSALRSEAILARKAKRLRLAELAGADGNEIKILAGRAGRRRQFQRPARLAVGPPAHRAHAGPKAHQAVEPMVVRIVGKIGVDLRPFRPFRVGVRHGLVGVAIEVLWTLRLHIRIGTRRIPDAAETAGLLHDGDLVSMPRECLCCCEPGHAGADHANLLWADHVIFLSMLQAAVIDRASRVRRLSENASRGGLSRSPLAAESPLHARPKCARPRPDRSGYEACRTTPRASASVKPRTARAPACRIC